MYCVNCQTILSEKDKEEVNKSSKKLCPYCDKEALEERSI